MFYVFSISKFKCNYTTQNFHFITHCYYHPRMTIIAQQKFSMQWRFIVRWQKKIPFPASTKVFELVDKMWTWKHNQRTNFWKLKLMVENLVKIMENFPLKICSNFNTKRIIGFYWLQIVVAYIFWRKSCCKRARDFSSSIKTDWLVIPLGFTKWAIFWWVFLFTQTILMCKSVGY